jgi:FkbM family methyltransferase
MYKHNNGLIEWHLEPNDFKKFIEENNYKHVKYYSQQDEDKYILRYILKPHTQNGTFLEIGACDGILYTNTKMLEDHFGFSGILIEPQPFMFEKLKQNRPNCKCYNYAISNTEKEYVEFSGHGPCGGIDKYLNVPQQNKYNVKNSKMKDIIKDSGFEYIDFMFIDVEGGEYEVLQTIDFEIPIYCIIIEAHSNQQEKNKIFGKYLETHGFTYHERQRGNEVWINKTYLRKQLFKL